MKRVYKGITLPRICIITLPMIISILLNIYNQSVSDIAELGMKRKGTSFELVLTV